MRKVTHEYLMEKLVFRGSLLVLVVMMLIYRPPTWTLEESKATEVHLGVA